MTDEANLAALRVAHRRMLDSVAELDDESLEINSKLPGWSRAMLISHLRYGAEAQLRGIQSALLGQSAEMYPGGEQQRTSEIESGRGKSPRELHGELADACRRLEDVFAGLSEHEWTRPVISRRGAIPVTEVLMQRWLDVEVHMIDLDIGQAIEDLSEQLADAYLPKLVAMLPALRRRPDADQRINGSWLLIQGDRERVWRICADGAIAWECDQDRDPTATITGSAQQLFAILLGRLESGEVRCTNITHAAKIKNAFPGP